MPNQFNPISKKEQHRLLAAHTPPGAAWGNTFNENDDFGRLFAGIAVEFYRFQILEKKLYDEMDIRKTNKLLSDWEESVGLPDTCFQTAGVSIEERRKQIEQKFGSFGGVQEAEDFIRVAAFFGLDISVTNGKTAGVFPLQFPIVFFSGKKEAAHTLFFVLLDDISSESTFPLPFPIPFSTGGAEFLQCIFEFLAPANVQIFIETKGDI